MGLRVDCHESCASFPEVTCKEVVKATLVVLGILLCASGCLMYHYQYQKLAAQILIGTGGLFLCLGTATVFINTSSCQCDW